MPFLSTSREPLKTFFSYSSRHKFVLWWRNIRKNVKRMVFSCTYFILLIRWVRGLIQNHYVVFLGFMNKRGVCLVWFAAVSSLGGISFDRPRRYLSKNFIIILCDNLWWSLSTVVRSRTLALDRIFIEFDQVIIWNANLRLGSLF